MCRCISCRNRITIGQRCENIKHNAKAWSLNPIKVINISHKSQCRIPCKFCQIPSYLIPKKELLPVLNLPANLNWIKIQSTIFNFHSMNFLLIMNNLVPFHELFLGHRQSGRTSKTNRSYIFFKFKNRLHMCSNCCLPFFWKTSLVGKLRILS